MSTPRAGSYGRWVAACAAAETLGMTAAATASRLGRDLADGGGAGGRWPALAVVVAGGLVEGAALGALQGRVLWMRWPRLRRTRFALLTVLVAGAGWAAGSAPGVLAGDDGTGTGPQMALVMLGGVGLGAVMGPVLGGAQAVVLRGVVLHPWRWVAANAAAWPVAMAVIFSGASSAGADWSINVVAWYGAVTGLLAGTALGLVSGWWLGSLDGQPMANRLALALVARSRLGIHRRLVGLGVTGRRTGRDLRFPVQFAGHGAELVVVPGHPEHKNWWRNLCGGDVALWVLDGSGWHTGWARVLLPGEDGHEAALAAYQRRWPTFQPAAVQPVVVLHLVGPGIPAVPWGLWSVRW